MRSVPRGMRQRQLLCAWRVHLCIWLERDLVQHGW
jgi:hypothetical protein